MYYLVVGKPLTDTENGGILSYLFSNPSLIGERLDVFFNSLLHNFGWPWLLVALFGLVLIFWGDYRLGAWILLTALLSAPFTFTYQIPDYSRCFTIHLALLSLGLAMGIGGVVGPATPLIGRTGASASRFAPR